MANRFNLKYEYSTDLGVTWTDITDAVDSRQTVITHNLCTNNFTSAKDEASITLPSTNLAVKQSFIDAMLGGSDILMRIYAPGDVDVLWEDENALWENVNALWRGSVLWFTGYVDVSSVDLRSFPLPASITVKIQDVSVKNLDNAPKKHILYENYYINQIVAALLTDAGYSYDSTLADTTGILDVNGDNVMLDAFVIDKDDTKTYRQYIDTLLFEAGGYVLDFNENGIAGVVLIPWENPVSARTVDNPMIANGVRTRSAYLKEDGAKVKWSTLKWSSPDQVVWMDSISRSYSNDGTLLQGETIQSGRYWPDGGEVSPTFMEYQAQMLDKPYLTRESRKENKDLSIIRVKNPYLYIQATQNGSAYTFPTPYPIPAGTDFADFTTNPTYYPKKAWCLLYNNSGSDVDLQFFTIRGEALYRAVVNTTETSDAKNPKEYESTYIYSKTQAERFLDFYWHFLNTSRTTMQWSEPNAYDSLNEVVQITHKGQGNSILGVIVGKTTRFINDNVVTTDFSAVGVSTFSLLNKSTYGVSPDGNARQGAQGQTPDTYTLETTLTAVVGGTFTARIYKNGTFDSTNTYYVQASYLYNGTWNNVSGWQPKTITTGTANVTLNAEAVRARLYADSAMTELLATGFVSFGETGEEAKVWDFSMTSETYSINRRSSSDNADITLASDIQGYSITSPSWSVVDANGTSFNSWLSATTGASVTLTIPYINSAVSPLEVRMSYSGMATVIKNLTGVDETYEPIGMYLGEFSALPTTPIEGDTFISGDYFIASTAFTGTDGNSYLQAVPYYYNGSSWYNVLDINSSTNAEKALKCLSGILDNGITVPNSNDTHWGWFANLVAQNAVIQNLFARAINILSNGYIRGGDRYKDDNTGTMATNAWNKSGFWFGADGRLMANLQSDANNNTFVGTSVATTNASVGSYNTAMGYGALHSNASGGNYNVALGDLALYSATTADHNIAIGHQALYSDATASYNIGLGYQTLYNTTGSNNIGIGYQALYTNGAGSTNLAIGYRALYTNTGSNNIGVGQNTLYANTSGAQNVAIGVASLYYNTTGDFNTGVGNNALRGVTTGQYNIGLGADSSVYSGSGHYQTAIGDSFICLEFNSGRRYSAVFDALKWAFNTYGMVSCIGFYGPSRVESISYMRDDDKTPCIRVETRSSDVGTSIYMYGNSPSEDTLSDRLVVMMPKPKNMPNHTDDCLS